MRLRNNRNRAIPISIRPPTPAPTPIPAFAPVDKEEPGCDVAVAPADVLVGVDMVVGADVVAGRSVGWWMIWKRGARTIMLWMTVAGVKEPKVAPFDEPVTVADAATVAGTVWSNRMVSPEEQRTAENVPVV